MSFMSSSVSMWTCFVVILHLFGFTCIRHWRSQCSMFSSSCLSLFLACVSLFFPVPNDLVSVMMSSANCVLTVSMYRVAGMSFTKMLNSSGPITEPCGTPAFGVNVFPVEF